MNEVLIQSTGREFTVELRGEIDDEVRAAAVQRAKSLGYIASPTVSKVRDGVWQVHWWSAD